MPEAGALDEGRKLVFFLIAVRLHARKGRALRGRNGPCWMRSERRPPAEVREGTLPYKIGFWISDQGMLVSLLRLGVLAAKMNSSEARHRNENKS